MIVDAELPQGPLDDAELRMLELELRTGGSINIRQSLRAVLELQATRAGTTRVQELEETVAGLEDQIDDLKQALRDAEGESEDFRRSVGSNGL
jgi:bacterioferritin (cytochrome b1)